MGLSAIVGRLQGAEVPEVRPQTYLGAFAYRFNHRFDLRNMIATLIVDVARTKPAAKRAIRVGYAEAGF
jgi:hypothetical protein